MKTIAIENQLIKKGTKKLEKLLGVKISIKNNEISFDGNPEDEYIAEKVIDALNFNFPFSIAMLIKKEDFLFEIINIKDYTKRKDFETIRARIIGKSGKTIKTISQLTDCRFELKDNEVGIIGSPECIKNAQDAIILIVQGSKQANVYAFLEKHHIQPVLDLGLKKPKKNRRTYKRKIN